MKIMPNRMDRGFFKYQEEFENKAVEVLRSGWYVLGKEVSAFEEEFAILYWCQILCRIGERFGRAVDCISTPQHWGW